MTEKIKNHVLALISMVVKKTDLHQMIFDFNHLTDKISYKTVILTGNESDRDKLIILATEEIQKIGSDTLKKYLQNLIVQNEINIFEPAHLKAFSREFEQEALKTDFIEITSAVEINSDDTMSIAKKISDKIGRKVIVDIHTKPEIIGGAIIKKDNYIIDFSIQTKLLNLSKRWKETLTNSHKK